MKLMPPPPPSVNPAPDAAPPAAGGSKVSVCQAWVWSIFWLNVYLFDERKINLSLFIKLNTNLRERFILTSIARYLDINPCTLSVDVAIWIFNFTIICNFPWWTTSFIILESHAWCVFFCVFVFVSVILFYFVWSYCFILCRYFWKKSTKNGIYTLTNPGS